MVYCQKCGTKNDDESQYCKKCGASLSGRQWEKTKDDRCEEECAGKGGRGFPIFWGLIIILVGLWVVFEFALKSISGLPAWLTDFPFWGIFALLVGLFIIIWGIRVVSKR